MSTKLSLAPHTTFKLSNIILGITVLLLSTGSIYAQTPISETPKSATLPASEKYHKTNSYEFFWGKHYRKEWHTPITVSKTIIDTLAGGLIPYQTGGGRQSKSLRLRDKDEREYVLRSIDKTFGKALPEIVQGTFIESIANDQVTISHPYAAAIVAPLAEAAKIYHATPKFYYVPKQNGLKEFNDTAGNTLYLFEKRPDENWSTEPDFGNAKNIIGTDKMLEKLLEDNDNSVDEKAFVKARLFDMLIGDWGRHEDQWRWAEFKDKEKNKTVYVPIPRDRDNAFSIFDGFLLGPLIKMANAKHLQSFDYKIKNLNKFNFPARNLDHHLLGELTQEEWITAAKELQTQLSDKVIDDAVKNMPPEVYSISGPTIAAKLKSRRALLTKYAKQYFLFLSEEVELTGTKENDFFEIKRLSNTETEVNIYKIDKQGAPKEKAYYSRTFKNDETREIRLYGISGNDEYSISGDVTKGIKIRMIGGPDKDKYVDESKMAKGGRRAIIYDDYKNDITKSAETKTHLTTDTAVHAYKYDYFRPNKNAYTPIAFYSNEDRIFVGYKYSFQKRQWRKEPFGMQHYVDVKYSFAQHAISSTYKGSFTELIGKWDLNIFANYDQERWTNFYGLGNETVLTTSNREFNRVRSRQFLGKIGIQRVINNEQRITFNPYFLSYDIAIDTGRYLVKSGTAIPNGNYKTNNYLGAELEYVYQHINDSILPTRGFTFRANGNYSHNINTGNRDVAKFLSEANVYIPFSRKISLSVKAGATTLTGKPEFFQYNVLGNTETVRGHQRDRYYGNSTAYNQNELRWISNVRSYLFNGKIGFFGLFDAGRLWLKGENSNLVHTSYGGGIILSPYNLVSVSVAYAKSEEDYNIHISLIKPL